MKERTMLICFCCALTGLWVADEIQVHKLKRSLEQSQVQTERALDVARTAITNIEGAAKVLEQINLNERDAIPRDLIR